MFSWNVKENSYLVSGKFWYFLFWFRGFITTKIDLVKTPPFAEVYEELERLGVTDFEGLSKCLLEGMLAGYVKVPAGGDLDTVLYELQG